MIRVLKRAGVCALLLGLFLATISAPADAQKKSGARKADARAAGADAGDAVPERRFTNDLPDPPAPGTLPDDYVMIRVDDHSIGAREFVDSYFAAYAADRPGQDSLGRVAFMKNLIHKELLALEAKRLNQPLSFEDRLTLREHSERVYSNLLYQRVVVDPVQVNEEEVRKAYELFKTEVRLRQIVFESRETGERVRRDLLAARIGWTRAVQRYSFADKANDGDIGWQPAGQIGLGFATITHRMKPGEISPLIRSREGWTLVQCLERRDLTPPSFEGIATLIRGQLHTMETNERADALQDSLADQIGLVIDTTNVRWAASQFAATSTIESEGGPPVLTLNTALPDIAPEDTARVLARYRGGQLSLGGLLHEYAHLPPLLRPNLNDFSLMRSQVIATAVDPLTIELAIGRGMDQDPIAIRQVERKREQLLVERLYEDSVGSRVRVAADERRRYYDDNRHKFVTFPEVTFAAITRPSRAGIDSVAARIRAGESPVAILSADSLAGRVSGSVQRRFQNVEGAPYHKVLFEELRPGALWIGGPDRDGDFILIHLLARDDGRQVSYSEAADWVDETLQNLKSERLLNELLERLARRYRVAWRPDLVMRTDFRMDRS